MTVVLACHRMDVQRKSCSFAESKVQGCCNPKELVAASSAVPSRDCNAPDTHRTSPWRPDAGAVPAQPAAVQLPSPCSELHLSLASSIYTNAAKEPESFHVIMSIGEVISLVVVAAARWA